MLTAINYKRTSDVLWFVGDLVNRGPQSIEVLRFIRRLISSIRIVLGNHDLHGLAVKSGQVKLDPGDNLDSLLAAEDVEALMPFLRHQPLRRSDWKTFLKNVYGDTPPCWDDRVTGWARYRLISNYFTRMRFVDTVAE